ncbi:MAG: hypothetical protein ACK4YP_03580 [Myxococcota bacterium]
MLLFALLACDHTLTNAEAREALEEAVASAKAEAVTGGVVELATGVTLGAAVEDAAEELRAFAASQVPCSTVTRVGATVTIDFGALEDACTWNGHTYAGVATVIVEANTDAVEVTHLWEGLTNGEVTVDGGATVTWSDASRRVVHDVTWTDGERTVQAGGDRTQRLLDPDAGIAGGIVVDGERHWVTDGEGWDLAIEGVEMRGQDPVPQAGVYTVTTPAGKRAVLSFARLDDDTIEVTLTGTRRPQTFEVTSTAE